MPVPYKVKEFLIEENDTSSYVLKLAYDSLNQPIYFFRNIFTPVCHTNVCQPVYINLYWDLVGNYLSFDFPPGKTLTKLDHEEFAPTDYEKMQAILANKNSLLKDYKMEELVGGKTVVNGVDGVTGATLKTVKKEVIEGAVYTCHTLWHLANGDIEKEILNITDKLANPKELLRFFQSDNYHYHYFAVDKVFEEPALFEELKEEVFRKFEGESYFLARYIIENIPDSYLEKESHQLAFLNNYESLHYSLQLSLLKRFWESSITISEKSIIRLSGNIENETYGHFAYKHAIFKRQESLPLEVENYYIEILQHHYGKTSVPAENALIKYFPKSKKSKKAIRKARKYKYPKKHSPPNYYFD
ncbi:hypothetical protein R9208_11985 [Flammeovirgaceae bacterium SG7u.132]|nr:hypothetical protein [Flammeovirgaceae bacterium SG7u.132]